MNYEMHCPGCGVSVKDMTFEELKTYLVEVRSKDGYSVIFAAKCPVCGNLKAYTPRNK